MSRAFSIVSYLIFLGVFGYSIAFVGGFGAPRTVDVGGPSVGGWSAVVIDVLLLSAFAMQHSVMARPGFKRVWTRVVPPPLERSCYVLIASALLALVFWHWRPLPAVLWDLQAPVLQAGLWVLFGLGWLLVLVSTFAIDHAALFGLRPQGSASFRKPWLYRLVRHPMMTGFFIAFLATPRMSVGHLLFAALSCGYILVAVRLEERDLAASLPEYASYAATTPRFCPVPQRWRMSSSSS